ncbi:MAG: 4-phosphopantoate--beta-alanine ligase [Halobacteriota archaeon]
MDDGEVPPSHPRADSLRARARLVEGVEAGLTSRHGLIAHGRGEAFDYLLGEETIPSAREAARVGAAVMLLADRPVVSVNGNLAALAPAATVELAAAVDARLEVNLFHRSDTRVRAIAGHLREHGADDVLGTGAEARIPDLAHDRATVHEDGIYDADVVLIPLEDGDRAEALDAMGKTEVVIDLNPLSRSARTADVPIIDNVLRALPAMTAAARELADEPRSSLQGLVEGFDADRARGEAERRIRGGDLAGVELRGKA